ncbi:MAG: hypothetical protein ACYDDF_11525 [Thermoplasmatota archaeon]
MRAQTTQQQSQSANTKARHGLWLNPEPRYVAWAKRGSEKAYRKATEAVAETRVSIHILFTFLHGETRGALCALAGDDGAATGGFDSINTVAFVIAVVIVIAVVGLTLLNSLFPTYSGSVRGLSKNMSVADWGNPTANNLDSVFSLLISLGGIFAIVAIVFFTYSYVQKHNKGGL